MVIRYQIVNTFLVWVCTRSGLVEKSLLIADIILIGQHFGLWWYPLNPLFYHLLLPVVQSGAPGRNQRRSNRSDDQADKSPGKTTSITLFLSILPGLLLYDFGKLSIIWTSGVTRRLGKLMMFSLGISQWGICARGVHDSCLITENFPYSIIGAPLTRCR